MATFNSVNKKIRKTITNEAMDEMLAAKLQKSIFQQNRFKLRIPMPTATIPTASRTNTDTIIQTPKSVQDKPPAQLQIILTAKEKK